MFELKAKDASVVIANQFKQLMVSMRWNTPVDFDLFTVYQTKEDRMGIIYYADLGNLNEFPFILLSGDEGVDDTAGDNEESLVISDLSKMKYIWICAWDYNKVMQSTQGRFQQGNLRVTVTDDKGQQYQIPMVDQGVGNMALMMTIDCNNPLMSRLINTSNVNTLNGLDTSALIQFLKETISSIV
jgi:tellurite resistance protein TerA